MRLMREGNIFIIVVWWGLSGVALGMLRRIGERVRRRLAAVERTPTSAIAQAPREGVVEIVGRVVASERGFVRSTATARQAVYARTLVERVNGSSRETVLDDLATRPFLVDDGSGATAWVEVDETVHAVVAPSQLAGDEAESARIGELLIANDIMDSTHKLVWQEWLIEEGVDVYVLGDASAMSTGPTQTQYRDQPGQRLRISAPAKATGREMLVSTYGERGLVAQLKVQRLMFRFATALIVITALAVALFVVLR